MMPTMPMPRATGDPIVPIAPATTLTYDQSAQLMTDLTFRGRVKTACLKYALSIVEEPTNVTAHTSRVRWAQSCYQSPDMVAGQIQSPVVMDPAVQSAGSAIADNALQGATEAVINQVI